MKSIVFVILLMHAMCYAQLPLNLVPNWSFDISKNGNVPNCLTNVGGLFGQNDDINEYIEYWYTADPNQGKIGYLPTPDWIGLNCISNQGIPDYAYQCRNTILSNNSMDRFIGMIHTSSSNWGANEGIRTHLNQNLIGGKKYFFRAKVIPFSNGSGIKVSFSTWGPNWNHKSRANVRFNDAVKLNITDYYDFSERCNWYVYEQIIIIPTEKENKLSNIVIVADGDDDRSSGIDEVELYEYCPNLLIRQNRVYKFGKENEEAKNIFAGKEVDNVWPSGEVIIKADMFANVVYKAENEVVLSNGFSVERGSEFTAKIAPCGRECNIIDASALQDEYIMCDNNCVNVINDISISRLSFQWVSASENSFTEYLSDVNIANPTFCLPEGAFEGTYVYNLTVTNPCGETVTRQIRFIKASYKVPNFTIISNNLQAITDKPELSIKPDFGTEWLKVEIQECNGPIVKTYEYKNGIHFNSDLQETISWSLPEALDPCKCYNIKVSSKSYCNPEIKTEEYSWQRNTAPTGYVIPTYATCIDGRWYICIGGSGIASIDFRLRNQWGGKIEVEQKENNCFVLADNDYSAGVYFLIVEFIGCDGSVKEETTTITLFGCGDDIAPDFGSGDNWLDDRYGYNVHYETAEGGLDSLYSTISPNPTSDFSVINYHLPYSGKVKITVLNSNFEQRQVIVNSDNMQAGDYAIQFGVHELLNGINYYKIELIGQEQTAREIVKYSVVH